MYRIGGDSIGYFVPLFQSGTQAEGRRVIRGVCHIASVAGLAGGKICAADACFWCHSFYTSCPPEEYFEEHSERARLCGMRRRNGKDAAFPFMGRIRRNSNFAHSCHNFAFRLPFY